MIATPATTIATPIAAARTNVRRPRARARRLVLRCVIRASIVPPEPGARTGSGAAGAGAGAGAGVGVEERAEGEEWRAVARHEAAARVGQVTTASFSAMGKDPWKVNVEFPAKLEVLAAGRFTPAAQVLRRDAAARLDEHELRFDLGLTPQEAGEHPVEFKLKFGVCNAERCVTREAVFRWTYRVEAP
jgi:hypothetical protein